jgi:membrane associated rhomboid family serine protease
MSEFERRPVVTYSLIAVNFLVFLLTLVVGLTRAFLTFGAVPALIVLDHEYYRLITSMFLHGDFLHILFNMWGLFIFGRDIESSVGSGRFTLLYFLSGIVGGMAYVLYMLTYAATYDPRAAFVPAIGASGAVFGVMGSFAVLYPRRPVAFFLYFLPIIAPAFAAITLMGLIQTLLALALPFSSIAYTAHVGGLAVGMLMGLWFRSLLRRRYYAMFYY